MRAVIYAKQSKTATVYEQFNACAAYAKRKGYSITGKVLDFNGNALHEAINKVIADDQPCALVVYNQGTFTDFQEAIFYRVYLEKLGKKLVICN